MAFLLLHNYMDFIILYEENNKIIVFYLLDDTIKGKYTYYKYLLELGEPTH